MAHTRTEYTIAAGFSGSDALAKIGEALFGLGIMTSATAWFDSFTDVSGSEVRIVEMAYTGNSGTYNKVYHSFATKSTFDGLWYTVYYNWDVSALTILITLALLSILMMLPLVRGVVITRNWHYCQTLPIIKLPHTQTDQIFQLSGFPIPPRVGYFA